MAGQSSHNIGDLTGKLSLALWQRTGQCGSKRLRKRADRCHRPTELLSGSQWMGAEVGRFLDNLEDLPGWMASLRRSETNFRWPMYWCCEEQDNLGRRRTCCYPAALSRPRFDQVGGAGQPRRRRGESRSDRLLLGPRPRPPLL